MPGSTKHLVLPSGAKMPIIGLGTAVPTLGKGGARAAENLVEAVKYAIDVGYRHIDTATRYVNEALVGSGIKAKIEDGTIKREDIFVATKLPNNLHHPDDVRFGLEQSLKALELDYIDLYYMHWPVSFKANRENINPTDEDGNMLLEDIDYVDTWKAMETLAKDGLVRDLGVSNFNSEQIQRVLDNSTVKLAVNQVESHPYFANTKLLKFCQDRGIYLTAFSPLGAPYSSWVPDEYSGDINNEKLKEIARNCHKSPAQVMLRWQVQRSVTVIPKSVTPERLKENIEIFDFELSQADMETLNSLDFGPKARIWSQDSKVASGNKMYDWSKSKFYPFNIPF